MDDFFTIKQIERLNKEIIRLNAYVMQLKKIITDFSIPHTADDINPPEIKEEKPLRANLTTRALTADQVRLIRSSSETNTKLADLYNVSNSVIGDIKKYKSYRDIT